MIRNIDDLVAFLRQFHRRWLDALGLDPSAIPRDLPDGLRLLYREFGALVEIEPGRHNHRTPFAAQDALMPLRRLKLSDDGMIEFAWENQGNWSCRCPLGPGDPPVYSNARDVWNEEQLGFQKVCDSLSHFLITLSLQEAVMSAPCLLTLEAESLGEALEVPIEPLWLGGWYVSGWPTHDFYIVPGHDLLVMNYSGFWVGAHEESALDFIRPEHRRNRIH